LLLDSPGEEKPDNPELVITGDMVRQYHGSSVYKGAVVSHNHVILSLNIVLGGTVTDR